jgi:multicomponent Na+:H+ antiporter subunit G
VSLMVNVLSWGLLLAGGAFCVIGALGLVRLRGFFPRTHASSVIDGGGAGLILAGLILQAGWTLVAVKLVAIGVLIFFASPTAAHALANAALARGLKLESTTDEEVPSKR